MQLEAPESAAQLSLQYSSFNSILVQLEDDMSKAYEQAGISFNSILVQLEGVAYADTVDLYTVSIPYWCN